MEYLECLSVSVDFVDSYILQRIQNSIMLLVLVATKMGIHYGN